MLDYHRPAIARRSAPRTLARRSPRKEVPTLARFAPRYVEGHAKANRQKPSTIRAKETIIERHLVPRFGDRKLDQLGNEQVQQLKGELAELSNKTVNNVLSTLNTLLKVAVEWEVIDSMPCTIKLLKVAEPDVRFYDFDRYEDLIEAAKAVGSEALLVVLLGGDAGLRLGEIIALEQSDVDYKRGSLVVQQSEWLGEVGLPKGGRIRRLPLTRRLAEALKAHRHLRGPRVLYRADGRTVNRHVLRNWLKQAERRAGLEPVGALHVLRHTFCSHLAMKGAPTRAIQELAGHKDLKTTQRYMHLSPAAIEDAIRLLDERGSGHALGDILETTSEGSSR